MKKFKIVIVLFCLSSSFAFAQTQDSWQPVTNKDESSKLINYQSFAKIPDLNIKIPTVVQVSVRAEDIKVGVDIFDNTTKTFVYSSLDTLSKAGPRVTSVESSKSGNVSGLFDNNNSTYTDFYLDGKNSESVRLSFYYSEFLKSDSVTLFFANNVTLPDSVTIMAKINGQLVTLVNKVKPTSTNIRFPLSSSDSWIIEMTYSQPLRVSEITFNNTVNIVAKKIIRFLAQPNHDYSLYANSENNFNSGYAWVNLPELKNVTTIKDIGMVSIVSNQTYIPEDSDGDGIANSKDNCPNISNTDQQDVNNNRVGDKCDDFDLDGVINNTDNCSDITNRDQKDTDGDGIGDLCDEDESRLTEKHPAVVWFGIGFATLIFLGLLFVAGNKIRKNNQGIDSNNIPPVPPTPQI